jgi:23S rRNA pseudouridine1911/1915/1917 synthase
MAERKRGPASRKFRTDNKSSNKANSKKDGSSKKDAAKPKRYYSAPPNNRKKTKELFDRPPRQISAADIIYEDPNVIIINKKAGDIAQSDLSKDASLGDLLKAYIKRRDHKPGEVFMGLVHRLDRPVSGAMVFAKRSKALSRLNEAVKNREIKKTYWAIVPKFRADPEGSLEHYLKKNGRTNKSRAYENQVAGSKKAVLHYKLLHSLDSYDLLEIQLESGRHHQIRCQLAHIGYPIVGDLKYGAQRSNKDGSICLHARRLGFIHPTQKDWIEVEAELPPLPIWKHFKKYLSN